MVCACLVAQSCLTLCNPKDYSPPGSSVHGDSPRKNTGVGCHDLLQGIFLTPLKLNTDSVLPDAVQVSYVQRCLEELGQRTLVLEQELCGLEEPASLMARR